MIDFSKLDKVAEYKNGELQWLEGRDINAIYVILVGDEYYIGSSHYVYLRIGQHLKALLSGSHHSDKLQEKFREVHDFDVFVLERGIDNKRLLHTEEHYIKEYEPTLNIVVPSKNKNGMEHRIKELIKSKGYTQQEFADKLGMSRIGLTQLVNGKPSYPTLEKIAKALDVEMWELFATKEDIMNGDKNTITCPVCQSKFELKEK